MLVVGSAAVRVLAPVIPFGYLDMTLLAVSGLAWARRVHALFAVGYAPIFLRARR